ncbi:MAG: phosphoribosylformimino-5-aminoimidazole carboxamide ribotide isomerase [Lachnospiraceae bacterium]|nr:phosphoribosylformimino-5-aminoimidazole carboxamide ribotide isomerase [Lachnospiraceae bacterium]
MRFRPCIDIHDGKVKQIIGGSLSDSSAGEENYVSERDAAYYAEMYSRLRLSGGHVIILNSAASEYYEESKQQALSALSAFPGGLMVGGGIHPENAGEFLAAGASHVIVTSYVFHEGKIDYDRLRKMCDTVGRERLCLDLSCRRKNRDYIIVTDRWQRFTEEKMRPELLEDLAKYASEYLIHAVDVEGRQQGIEGDVIPILIKSPIPVTYAGGVGDISDIAELREAGRGKIDITVGSALKIFGGNLEIGEILECIS